MKQLALGLVLTAAVTAITAVIWGRGAIGPAAAFGLLATGIQLVAVRFMRRAVRAPFHTLVQRWGMGMGLRLAGVALLAVAMAVAPDWFEPLPSAAGFLGVLIPLLFTETQFLK